MSEETKTCGPRCKATNSAGDRCYLDRGHLDLDHVFSFPPPREMTDEAAAKPCDDSGCGGYYCDSLQGQLARMRDELQAERADHDALLEHERSQTERFMRRAEDARKLAKLRDHVDKLQAMVRELQVHRDALSEQVWDLAGLLECARAGESAALEDAAEWREDASASGALCVDLEHEAESARAGEAEALIMLESARYGEEAALEDVARLEGQRESALAVGFARPALDRTRRAGRRSEEE